MESKHLTNAIQTAIDSNDDTGHPDAFTVEEVNEVLTTINEDIITHWDEYADSIDDGAYEIVHETQNTIVIADNTEQFWNEQFEVIDKIEFDEYGILRRIVSQVHHTLADTHVDRSWSTTYPVVVEKTPVFKMGEDHVLRAIARKTKKEGSVARAVDKYATEVHGIQKSTWANLTGRNRSSVTRTTTSK